MRNPEILARQLRLVTLLVENVRGLSSARLAALLQSSRPTVDRDLRLLRDRVELPIERLRVNGEVWHRLSGVPLRLSVSPLQLAAIALAREALAPLAGASIVRELDALLTGDASAAPTSTGVRVRNRPPRTPSPVVATLEAAITSGHRVQIVTRVASRGGELREYVVEPITVRLTQGEAYLDAWSVERDALRTYKVARILEAVLLRDEARTHSDVDLDAVFRASVRTWSGDVIRARIRIGHEVAWAVAEYPLVADQLVIEQPDGAVVIEAEVAGLVETSRWVLSWGRHAEALSPQPLRDLIESELRRAIGRYEGPASEVRSTMMSELEVPPSIPTAPEVPRSTTRPTHARGSD